ncbi:arginase family protein [Parasalinivibrio latis]|uniref:arginase family protein n=1 Tax=Parasalinivibrio latis TaxID=2952610 RepID=UPI0030DE73C6
MLFDPILKLFQRRQAKPGRQHAAGYSLSPLKDGGEAGLVLVGAATDLSEPDPKSAEGARLGPQAILETMKPISRWPIPVYSTPTLSDYDTSVEDVLSRQYQRLRELFQTRHLPVVLGGGHEVALSSYKALSDHAAEECGETRIPKIGVINMDAHFELRTTLAIRSGAAFHFAANHAKENGRPFQYMVLGIDEKANPASVLERARSLNAKWVTAKDMSKGHKKPLIALLDDFLADVDYLHLSIDLDVFSSALAPGVAMPQSQGISYSMATLVIDHLLASGKVRVIDIAELVPDFDWDNQTANLAVKLLRHIARKQADTEKTANKTAQATF